MRINMIVEGQTEEIFVNTVLSPFLGSKGVFAVSRRVETSRQGTKIFRGGLKNFQKAERDIQRWLSQDSDAYVTTMFDFYGLPLSFPNRESTSQLTDPYRKVQEIEKGLGERIGNRRFIPYIQLHEFEALLFSDVAKIDALLVQYQAESCLEDLQRIIELVASPEEINDNPTSAPSKRLLSLYPTYDKTVFGPAIAEDIGIEMLRQMCPHFNEWLEKLELLALPLQSA